MIFPLTSPVTSAVLSVGMGGFQADQFGQFLVSLNGVLQPNFFNFQDGIFNAVERMFTMDAVQLALINAASEFRLTIDRGGSSDATSFDYFQLDYTSDVVPEPASMVLLGTGLLGLAVMRRRRNRA